ncbi:MAG TPA: dihydrolipoamide acetyltransferase family protein [Rhizomicrobium sp.]|nr:dihydrolipoamide acetyltransferase family protein [Rhizomicrobium sp.]
MYEFRMPSLGADMEAGTLVEWLKHPGDRVARGDIVAVVETDKGAIEIEIFVAGTMGKQVVALGAKVPVGTTLALIEGVAEERRPPAPRAAAAPRAFEAPAVPPSAVAAPAPGLRVSPAARKLARERGIDLATIKGSGPDGSIVLHDVERVGGAPARRGLDLNRMRQAIAAAMARSKREIPHYYLATDIDMSKALDWLQTTNAGRTPGNRLLPAVLTLKAVAHAARKYPAFNGTFDPASGFTAASGVHIGVAIAVRGGGLASPAVHDCDQQSLDDLMGRLRDLVARTREGRLRSSEMSDATLTVSSLGERGVETLYGIIYPPQVAIVGFGRVASRPVAVDGQVVVRNVMSATLAGDHRVTDGHLGSLFLREIDARLQEPDKL